MTTPFGQPQSGGDMFKMSEYEGALVLFENIQPELEEIDTNNGPAKVARCNVTVLGAGEVETFEDTFVFGRAVAPALARSGKKGEDVLARIGQGEAKKGQSAPWILEPHTEKDAAAAMAYIKSRDAGRFSQPAAEAAPAPAAAPAAAPVDLSQVDPAQLQALLAQLGSKPGF